MLYIHTRDRREEHNTLLEIRHGFEDSFLWLCSATGGHTVASFRKCVEQSKLWFLLVRKTLTLACSEIVFWPLFACLFQLHIVYMGEKKHDDPSAVTASHHDILTSVLGRYWLASNPCYYILVLLLTLCLVCNSKDESLKSIVYSYKHGFSGFAAMLTKTQARTLASKW